MSRRKELATALKGLVAESKDPARLTESIAAYLLATRQSKDIGALLRDLESIRFDQDGTLEVQVTSARPLSQEIKDQIKELFEAKRIIIHEDQDPSLLGGVKVRAHDRQLDYSVRTRLQRLKTGV